MKKIMERDEKLVSKQGFMNEDETLRLIIKKEIHTRLININVVKN